VPTESKAWDWKKSAEEWWNVPSEESYYLLNRWRSLGFKRILDLGCGLGRHSIQFAKADFDVFSFDLSQDGIDELNRKASMNGLRIDSICGDMLSLPYLDDSIDCLLAYHVISHTDTVGIRKVISEMKRVLRPGGEFYVTFCSKNSWSFKDAGFPRIDENTVRKIEDGPENGIPHFFVDEGSLEDILQDFEILSMRNIQDLIVDSKKYGSWHYFVLGRKEKQLTS